MPAISLRIRILLIVLAVGIAPIALTGWWVTGEAARSSEVLLRSRLRESIASMTAEIGNRWVRQRSMLLLALDDPMIGKRSADFSESQAGVDGDQFGRLELRGVEELVVYDSAGAIVFRGGADAESVLNPSLSVSLALHRPDGTRYRELRGRLAGSSVIPNALPFGAASGSTFTAIDRTTGAVLMPTPFDSGVLEQGSFHWAGQRWIVERRRLVEPELDLFAAAPLDPFIEPVKVAAARSASVFLLVAVAALALTAVLTVRVTRPLMALATAAGAVSRGDLARRIEPAGPSEIRTVTTAFNTMVVSLERTLAELSQREALSAVGSFASELAHEIRTPLTSIRIDLQVLNERIPDDPELLEITGDLLRTLERLERTVAGTLQVARSGRIELGPITLEEPLEAAVREAMPLFFDRQCHLQPPSAGAADVAVQGDADSLRRLFLNVLSNAAEALPEGGRAAVSILSDSETVSVLFHDDGPGIPEATADQVFQPFFTTKAQGTGLGLAIARRIADAHQGALEIESGSGAGADNRGGTTVTLKLRRAIGRPRNEA